MRHLVYQAVLALSAWTVALSVAAVAPPPSSIQVPWGEVFSALQESNLGQEDMRDLQQYMQDRIRDQQRRLERRNQQRQKQRGEEEEEEDGEAPAATATGAAAVGAEVGAEEPPPLSSPSEEEEAKEAEEDEGVFDWKATIAAFKEQARVIDRSIALRKAGNEQLAAGDVDAAQASYAEALKVLEAGTVVATARTRRCGHACQLNLAVAEGKKGQYASARGIYDRILAEEGVEAPVRLQCLAKRARIARRFGEVEAALADLAEANRLKPTDQKVAQELEELGGTPVPPPPPPPPSPFDALFSGSGLELGAGGIGGAGGVGGAGAGGGMPDLFGGLLGSALGSGAGGGAGGAGGGGLMEQMIGDYITSMGSRLVDMLDQPETLQMVCSMAKRLEPAYLKSLAQTANLPLGDGTIDWLHRKATSLEPEDLRRWVSRGKFAHRTYRATQRTWASVRPLLRPARLLLTYATVLRWMAACLY